MQVEAEKNRSRQKFWTFISQWWVSRQSLAEKNLQKRDEIPFCQWILMQPLSSNVCRDLEKICSWAQSHLSLSLSSKSTPDVAQAIMLMSFGYSHSFAQPPDLALIRQCFTPPHLLCQNPLDSLESIGLDWTPNMSYIITWLFCRNPLESAGIK